MLKKTSYEELVQKIARLEQENLAYRQLEKTVHRQDKIIQDNEEKFRLLFERTPLSYQSLDINGNILEVNQAWLQALGYKKDEVIGKKFSEFLHPEWVEHFKINFPRFKAIGEVLGVEFEMLKKDGSSILVAFNGKIGKDVHGNFLQTHCIFIDITERRRAELALAESEYRYRTIFESSPLGMVSYDCHGLTLDCNEKFIDLMGSTRDKIIGFNLAHHGSPEMQGAIKKALSGEVSVYEGAYTSITGDKASFIRIIFSPVTPGLSPSKVIATVEDVSKRKLAEEVIERRILSLTQPVEDASDVVFEDLFNLEDIQRLQDDFARATGVASIIMHSDGTSITRPSNFTRFCQEIICKTEKGRVACSASNAILGKLSVEGLVVRPCLDCGLWTAGAGISIGGHSIANWLICQVRDDTQNEGQLRRYAIEIGAQEEDFITAFHEVPVMPKKHFSEIAKALFTLANRLSITAYQNVQQARFISEIKKTQEKLRESKDRLRFALEGSNDGLWDANLLTGKVYLSRRSCEILGYATDEKENILDDWRKLVHPEELALSWERLVAHFKKKTPILRVEHRLLMKDGNWKWVQTRGKVVEWADNERALRLTGTITDISERKLIEKTQMFLLELGHSTGRENFFRSLARFLSEILGMEFVCIYRLEDDGLSARTEAFYWEGSFRDNITSALMGTPHSETISKAACRYAQGVRNLFPQDVVLQEMGAESYVGSVLLDSQGKAIGLVAALSLQPLVNPDLVESILKLVTIRAARELERKKVEAEKENLQSQLMQAQKMESVGRLAGGVAHDFNNMLGVILGHADLAQEQINPDDPLFEDLAEIRKAAQRSADLTRQLLAFARKQTAAPKVLDLNETVEGLLKMLRRLIGEDIDLVWQSGKRLWPVKIDPTQVDQILANLTVNARDAIDGVGKITIKTENAELGKDYCADHLGCIPGSYVMLSISDDGCGMNIEVQEHIFEPFFTTKEIGQGTGLGLATIYGIVKQNNGYIDVHSRPHLGTTFSIYLPRYLEKILLKDGENVMEALQQGLETILLVEDEPSILHMGKRMLESMGYKVLIAGTPGEAMRLAEENSGEIHLLMTDVVMPEMNGRDLARRLLLLYPDLKRLFMSGYTADVIAHHGVLDESVNFIQKPFSKIELSNKVRQVLRGDGGRGQA